MLFELKVTLQTFSAPLAPPVHACWKVPPEIVKFPLTVKFGVIEPVPKLKIPPLNSKLPFTVNPPFPAVLAAILNSALVELFIKFPETFGKTSLHCMVVVLEVEKIKFPKLPVIFAVDGPVPGLALPAT
ncbi:MAG: hypothetical protein BWY67_01328 [Bacteroidetes bacterium ADurb.Bin397]|nr:MAG: hypothetical protein BWY67_01328 [Bacteroidetes bacterium ADurb.Bin397]